VLVAPLGRMATRASTLFTIGQIAFLTVRLRKKDRSFSKRFRHPSGMLRLNDADKIIADNTIWNNFFDEVKGSIEKLRIPDDRKLLLEQASGRMNSLPHRAVMERATFPGLWRGYRPQPATWIPFAI
jgi:hypothetical protein